MATRLFRIVPGLAAAALLVSGCTVKKQETPPLTGPSELSTAISIQVSPDLLAQDGASQSLVTITARDANGQPIRSQSMRVDLRVGGVPVDFGTLSARSVVTDANGRASVIYTAPPAPGTAVPATDVMVVVTPTSDNFQNNSVRFATIRVVPTGVVVPPRGSVTPDFTFTPSAPNDNEPVLFDASASTSSTGPIVQWLWNFVDGSTGSGERATHSFRSAGARNVRLTVVDSIGASESITKTVTVGQGALPIATIVSSPASPIVGQSVNFNGSTSRPAPGRTIRFYDWDFGDGTTASGPNVQHAYANTGTYTVVLTVTDDAGRIGTATTSISVGTGNPTADFTFNPSAPRTGQQVTFDASASLAAPGRTIVSYSWAFGDGTGGTGQTVSKTYIVGTTTTFNVLLTVTDSQGRTSSVTKSITVTAP